jgi:hypothetical protein
MAMMEARERFLFGETNPSRFSAGCESQRGDALLSIVVVGSVSFLFALRFSFISTHALYFHAFFRLTSPTGFEEADGSSIGPRTGPRRGGYRDILFEHK